MKPVDIRKIQLGAARLDPPPDLCSKWGGASAFQAVVPYGQEFAKLHVINPLFSMLRQTNRQQESQVCFADNKWNQMDGCQLSLTSI